MKKILLMIVVFAAMVCVAVPVFAVPTVDSFDPVATGTVRALAVQTDGKIFVGGDFTSLGGVARNYIGRLNADGTLDATFNPGITGAVAAIAVQADGKVLVGGQFLGGVTRLNSDGSPDTSFTFGGADAAVYSIVVDADGKILLGGAFGALGASPRISVGRLNSDGSIDTTFDAGNITGYVYSVAVQEDGKILIGGMFTSPYVNVCRLNSNGSLDTSFNPGAGVGGTVFSIATQVDGKILVGGQFLGGVTRLNSDGSPDTSFVFGGADAAVYSIAVAADGKILLGGAFGSLGSSPRISVGRLNSNGSTDTVFDVGHINDYVYSMSVQADGKVLVGGLFTVLGGQSHNFIGRIAPSEPALQELLVSTDGTVVTWNRSGNSPEIVRVVFEDSVDGTVWSVLGAGARLSGGWQLSGLSLPMGVGHQVRARGYASGSIYESSLVLAPPAVTPVISTCPTSSTTGNFSIVWNASVGATFTLEVIKDSGAYTLVYSGTNNYFTVSGLANGSYVYRIKASKPGNSDSAWASTSAIAVTLAFSGTPTFTLYPTATSSTGNFSLVWSSTNIPGTTYILEVSTDSGATFSLTPAYSGTNNYFTFNGLSNGTYTYRVKATKSGYTDSAVSPTVAATVLLAYPAQVFSSYPAGSNTGNFTIIWNASQVPGTVYVLEVNIDNAGFTPVAGYGGINNYLTVRDLPTGSYVYRVKATQPGVYVESAWATTAAIPVSISTVTPAPFFTITPASSSTGNFTIAWNYVVNTTYVLEVSKDGAAYAPVSGYGGTNSYFTVSGLTNGSYVYRISATKSGLSASPSVTTTAIPVTLAFTAPAFSQYPTSSNNTGIFTLVWNSSNVVGTVYTLEVSTDGGSSFNPVAGYGGTNNYFSVSGQTNGSYIYRVSSTKSGYITSPFGTSPAITVVLAPLTCATPAFYVYPASSTTGIFSLVWTAAPVSGTTFILEVSTDGGTNYVPVAGYGGTNNYITVRDLATGSYKYRVTAKKAGYADSAAVVSPLIPVNLALYTPVFSSYPTNSTNGGFSLVWNSSNPTGTTYILESSTDNFATVGTPVYSGTNNYFTVSAQPNGTYKYRVMATNANNGGYAASSWAITSAITVLYACPTPVFVALQPTNSTGIYSIYWNSTNAAGTDYLLEVSTDGVNFSTAYTGTNNYYTTSVATNGTYTYRVSASKSGFVSSGLSATTTTVVTLALDTPVFLTYPNDINTTGIFTLVWNKLAVVGTTYTLDVNRNGAGYTNVYTGTNNYFGVTAITDGAYTYRLTASKAGFTSSGLAVTPTITVAVPTPTAPTPYFSTYLPSSTTGIVNIVWNNAAVDSYVLEVSKDGGAFAPVAGFVATNNYYTVSDLAAGTYIYRVKAVKALVLDSAWKSTSPIVVTNVCPNPVYSSYPASSNTGSFTINWNKSVVAGITYVLEESSDNFATAGTQVYSGPNNYFTVSGLVSGNTYNYRLTATKPTAFTASMPVTTDPIAVLIPLPTLATPYLSSYPASSVTGNFSVTWSASAIAGVTYHLEVSTDGVTFTPVVGYGGVANYFTFSGLAAASYTYRVKSTKALYQDSSWATTTAIPVTLSFATPTFTSYPTTSTVKSFTIIWQSSFVDGTIYVLEVSSDGGVTYIPAYNGINNYFTTSGLANGTYLYRIKATKPAVYTESAWAVTSPILVNITCSTPLFAPMSATSSTGTYSVVWHSDNEVGTNYLLEVSKDGGSFVTAYSGTNNYFTTSGLVDGTYAYRVTASKAGYATGVVSALASVIVTNTFATPVFTSYPMATNTTGNFSVSWLPSGVTGTIYILQVSKNSGAYANVSGYNGTDSFYTVSGLSDGAYTYQVKATKSGYADSPPATTNVISVLIPPPTYPVPFFTSVPPVSSTGTVNIVWNFSSLPGISYVLEVSTDGGTTFNSTPVYTGTNNYFTATGLTDGTYTYRVKATGSYIASGYSLSSPAVVVANAFPTPVFTAFPAASSNGAYKLSWSSSNVSGTTYVLDVDSGAGYTNVYTGLNNFYDVSGQTNGSYTYRVKSSKPAYAPDSSFGYTTAIVVTIPPPATSTPVFTTYPVSSSTGNFSITWSSSNVAGTDYLLEVDSGSGFTSVYSGLNSYYTVSGLSNGLYTYRVTASKSGYAISAPSSSIAVTVTLAFPAPAFTVAPVSNSTGMFSLVWNSSGVAGTTYALEVNKDGSGFVPVAGYDGTNNYFTVSGLTNGSYVFQVRPTKAGYSASPWATTAAIPVSLAFANVPTFTSYPTTISATGTFNLGWNLTYVPGTTYVLEVKKDAGAFAPVVGYGGTNNYFTTNNLLDGTYTYQVKATKSGYADTAWEVTPGIVVLH